MARNDNEVREGFDDPLVAAEYEAWLDERYGPVTDDTINAMFAADNKPENIIPITPVITRTPLKAA